eukprot:CAMPEP_0206429766 /NCGR_PEP_ID=MMETSP0324_2-20121206/6424_1 /ASSEMBLY_ACC=CAM_ASM_000836 /TAXON_ID=2866 /ORGANISM="Crypthecodinium cohnii, Strain Seligo" /LENGTH=116 /DNA_ID=CAMNT_0053895485 /DNA_START=147 /DNA_END=497 /DNA_ORIENTATION=+
MKTAMYMARSQAPDCLAPAALVPASTHFANSSSVSPGMARRYCLRVWGSPAVHISASIFSPPPLKSMNPCNAGSSGAACCRTKFRKLGNVKLKSGAACSKAASKSFSLRKEQLLLR